MPTYEELKEELGNIAALLGTFPEQVRPQVFDLLIKQYLGVDIVNNSGGLDEGKKQEQIQTRRKNRKPASTSKEADAANSTVKPNKKSNSSKKESYQIDRELNLRGDKSIPSFKSFVGEKGPSSAREFNVVAVYYLQKLLGILQVTLNQVYTCYKEVGRRPPEAFRQSFIDTKNTKGWIEFDEEGNLRVPHRGAVFVEHDLPSQGGKSEE